MPFEKMICDRCGAEMNHHAEKLMYSMPGDQGHDAAMGGTVVELHACPACGSSSSRVAR